MSVMAERIRNGATVHAHAKAAAVILLALLGLLALLLAVLGPHDAFDFRNAYMGAARAVVDGRSPYPPTGDWLISHDRAYVYPPTLAVLLAPLTLVSEWLAVLVWTLVCVGAVSGSLWLAGVRDARVYFVAYLWAPVYPGLQNLNASLVVLLLVAVAWRHRERAVVAGLAVGAAIALKLFVWPLVIWLAATRRWRAAAIAAASGVGMIALSWAVISFRGIGRYPGLLDELTRLRLGVSHSVTSIGIGLGLSRGAATAVAVVVGALLVGGCVRAARQGADAVSLMLALAAGLAVIPIVWQHHMLVLLIPLAVLRPRLSLVWFAMIPPWLLFVTGYGMLWHQVFATIFAAVVVIACAGPSLRRGGVVPPAAASA